MELLEKIFGTIILRWYVILFLTGYILLAVINLGWKRMFIFSIIGFAIGFLADYSSTHNGFPFGLYYYTQLTRDREIFIDNVPVITALSFIFLSYIGYNIATFIYSPLLLSKQDIQFVPTKEIEYSLRVSITGALIMMLIDMAIDPVTLQGRKWFLGDFYWYSEKGEHFGVPLTNYFGWFFVGFTVIFLFQRIDKFLSIKDKGPFKGQIHVPFSGFAGIIFYLSILVFMLAITLYIGEFWIAVSSITTSIPFILMLSAVFLKKSNRVTEKDFQLHFKDYPYSALNGVQVRFQLLRK